MEKVDDFAVRFQLVERSKNKVVDEFDMEIPEHVYGVATNKSETPFLVANEFFNRIRKSIKK